MTETITAIYEGGVLRPTTALPFGEGQTVHLTVTGPPPPLAPSEDEAIRQIREAKTLDELFARVAATAESVADDGDDLLEALNENRRLSGAHRMLFPPEEKGKTW
jgi:predicted DNA-binding antitoxin AbrB/MazE fold protein